MSQADESYKNILRDVMSRGRVRETRTGLVKTCFSPPEFVFDMNLEGGFPLLTGKQVMMRSVIGEALWFLTGNTDVDTLRVFTYGEKATDQWTIWSDDISRFNKDMPECWRESGGRLYGAQWRDYRGAEGSSVDQLQVLVDKLKNNPTDRYLIVNAWNGAEIHEKYMALPPCHVLFQCFVEYYDGVGYLDLKWYQRSVDTFLGLPFNIASYGFIMHVLCKLTGLKPGRLIGSFGDTQIYENHSEQVMQYMYNPTFEAPQFEIVPDIKCLGDLHDLCADDFLPGLKNYKHAGKISAPLSVG